MQRPPNCTSRWLLHAPDGSIVQPELMTRTPEAEGAEAAAEAQAAEEGGKELRGQPTDVRLRACVPRGA